MGPDKFPFRDANICLFIKDTIKSADALVNVQGVTSVPYSLFCCNIFLTEPSRKANEPQSQPHCCDIRARLPVEKCTVISMLCAIGLY